jgi:hypothetical protein
MNGYTKQAEYNVHAIQYKSVMRHIYIVSIIYAE